MRRPWRRLIRNRRRWQPSWPKRIACWPASHPYSAFLKSLPNLRASPRAYPEVSIPQEIFDGVRLRKGQAVASIRHNGRVLLSCERLILNLLQHLSGIATMTRKYVDAIEGTEA